MKRLLIFEIKPNSSKAPRIYVKCSITKDRLGSFLADNPDGLNGWDNLSPDQATEPKLFIDNLNAIKHVFGLNYLDELSNYQLKLPESLQLYSP